MRARSRATATAVTLTLVASLAACSGSGADEPVGTPGPDPTEAFARWSGEDPGQVGPGELVRGAVDLTPPAGAVVPDSDGAGDRPEASLGGAERSPVQGTVTVALTQARFTSIPRICQPSGTTRPRSYLLDGDTTLVCTIDGGRRAGTGDDDDLDFVATVTGGTGDVVTGSVSRLTGGVLQQVDLPDRTVFGEVDGLVALAPDLRLISSPDFLNADVGDLRKGPSDWDPSRSANSTNPAYEKVLGEILDDWASLDPAGVLVAGDLVDGRWGFDDDGTGNFGPVGTLAEQVEAVRRAARTYYPQWLERFRQRDLPVFPAVGDHELGDNPWTEGNKRLLIPTLRAEFARLMTRNPDGSPVFTDHPPSGPAEFTAYAGRPTPDVQVITLDEFDITPTRERIGIDPVQRQWLEDVLRRARRDKVAWVVVQGHVPVIYPVRARASSKLHYAGGTDSRLWRLFAKYGVDLYLSGEVHDVTTTESDGVVQISHGGAFQFGLTNALVMDFVGDQLSLSLRDYDVDLEDADDGARLWETRRNGMKKKVTLVGEPRTIGTALLGADGLESSSGLLRPLRTAPVERRRGPRGAGE